MLNLVLDGIISFKFSFSMVFSGSVIDHLVDLLLLNQSMSDNNRLVVKLFSTHKSIHSPVGIQDSRTLCVVFYFNVSIYNENIRWLKKKV